MRFQPNATSGVGATPEGNSTGLSANYTPPGMAQQVNLLLPGTEYADRINQIDVRVGKLLTGPSHPDPSHLRTAQIQRAVFRRFKAPNLPGFSRRNRLIHW
jgi:hypothetical protein